MESTKQASKNTTRLWGRPKWRGKELSVTTFLLLGLGLLSIMIVGVYYFFRQ